MRTQQWVKHKSKQPQKYKKAKKALETLYVRKKRRMQLQWQVTGYLQGKEIQTSSGTGTDRDIGNLALEGSNSGFLKWTDEQLTTADSPRWVWEERQKEERQQNKAQDAQENLHRDNVFIFIDMGSISIYPQFLVLLACVFNSISV